MREAKLHFESDAEIQTYVAACEARFACQLEAAGRYAVEHGQDILTLCGPTCSGKTTAAALLSKTFAGMGRRLHVISIDNFYYSREYLRLRSLRQGTDIDYDSPDTIDIDMISKRDGAFPLYRSNAPQKTRFCSRAFRRSIRR